MNVLHFIYQAGTSQGGGERQLALLVEARRAKGLNVDVMVAGPAVSGLPGIGLNIVGRSYWDAFWAARRALRAWATPDSPCVLHIHGIGGLSAVVSIAAWTLRIPVVTLGWSTGSGRDVARMKAEDGGWSGFLWWALRHTSRSFVALSSQMEEELVRDGVSAGRVRVIPNGVDLDAFSCTASVRPKNVVFVGRLLRADKGLDVLAAAWERVERNDAARGWKLVIVGDGPDAGWVRTTFGAMRSVHVYGIAPAPALLMCDAMVGVLPSRREGLSNVLLEYLASGLAVVATRISGNLDVLGSDHPFLADSGDTEDLASALTAAIALCSEPGGQASAASGSLKIAERYSLLTVSNAWEALYAEIARSDSP